MKLKTVLAIIVAAGLLVAALATAGCAETQDPCEVNPTRQAQDGTWVEADGEPLDSDPCDSDDLKAKKPKSKTTKPKRR